MAKCFENYSQNSDDYLLNLYDFFLNKINKNKYL